MACRPTLIPKLASGMSETVLPPTWSCSGPRPYSPDKGPANLGCYPEADYDLDLVLLVVYFYPLA